MIEIPESFCLFIHGCMNFIYPCHDFISQFLKEFIYFFLVDSIWFFSCREYPYLLQKLRVIGERPMPEYCLEIAGCKLGDRKEIL